MTHLWEVEHDYYCQEENYYSKETVVEYDSWQAFLADNYNSDMDYNLLFRWDWEPPQEAEYDEEEDPYNRLKLFWMGQRKGLYRSNIIRVTQEDEESIKQFLQPRLEHLIGLWAPMIGETNA